MGVIWKSTTNLFVPVIPHSDSDSSGVHADMQPSLVKSFVGGARELDHAVIGPAMFRGHTGPD